MMAAEASSSLPALLPPPPTPDRFAVIEAVLANNLGELYAAIFADCDVNLVNDVGNSPLHAACFLDVPSTFAALLLRAGAKHSARNHLGQTPLHFAAASSKDGQVVEMLLRAGADPLARDNSGATPRDLAKSAKAAEVLDAWLLRAWDEFLTLDPAKPGDPPAPQSKSPRAHSSSASVVPAPVEALLQSLQAMRKDEQVCKARAACDTQLPLEAKDNNLLLHIPPPPSPSSSLRGDSLLAATSPSGSFSPSPSVLHSMQNSSPLQVKGVEEEHQRAGFFVLVDGASVFVPAPTFEHVEAPTVEEPAGAAARSSESLEDVVDPVEELLADESSEAFASILLDDKEQSIGMLVREGDSEGALIAKVRPESKAAHAGIEQGDALLAVNGHSCAALSIDDISRLLKSDVSLLLRLRRTRPKIVSLLLDQSRMNWEEVPAAALASIAAVLTSVGVSTGVFHMALRAFQDGLGWLRKETKNARALEAKGLLARQLGLAEGCNDTELLEAAVQVIEEGLGRNNNPTVNEDVDEELSESFASTLSSLTAG